MYDFTVARDGSGDFITVQQAINAVPDSREKQTVVFIENGFQHTLYAYGNQNGLSRQLE